MPDGSKVVLKKLSADYDPTNADVAMQTLRDARNEQKLITGLLYVNTAASRFDDEMKMVDEPLASLKLEQVRPPRSVLDSIMRTYQEGSNPVGSGGG